MRTAYNLFLLELVAFAINRFREEIRYIGQFKVNSFQNFTLIECFSLSITNWLMDVRMIFGVVGKG